MIISKNVLPERILDLPEKALIIDIETTGFSPKFATIYMIGMVRLIDGVLVTEQWLTEKDSDEYELLFKLNQLLSEDLMLYHYNGDQFDMPFIKGRMKLYDIECHPYQSKDLLKIGRPYKKLMGLDNMKLKSIEAWFGYKREDPFSGGDLIEVYKAYKDQEDQALMKVLLLHNFEDLAGLVDIMVHMPLFDLLAKLKAGTYPISLTYSTIEDGVYEGRFKVTLPGNYNLQPKDFHLSFVDNESILKIPLISDELYYFFPDYKNYHYLVEEDYAIHKSIGQFVAKGHRVPATKTTAYVKKEGFFLSAGKRFQLPVPLYYRDKDQKQPYVAIEDLVEVGGFDSYIEAVLKHM